MRHLSREAGLEVVAINDLAAASTLAHLLQHDSSFGRWEPVSSGEDWLALPSATGERRVRVTRQADPATIAWGELMVDVVVEATGRFTGARAAARHLDAGAKRVLVSAVSHDADATVVLGLPPTRPLETARVISAASCTTHAAALPLALLEREFGLVGADVMTVHCVTGSQPTVDTPHTDLRRSRAALVSLIPTTTSASDGIVDALPQLAGRLSCLAVRVPASSVSSVQIVAQTARRLPDRDQIAALFRDASAGAWRGILATSVEPLVSVDFRGNPHSSIIDLPLLARPADHLVRVFAWYDNEWGYSRRLADLLRLLEGMNR